MKQVSKCVNQIDNSLFGRYYIHKIDSLEQIIINFIIIQEKIIINCASPVGKFIIPFIGYYNWSSHLC